MTQKISKLGIPTSKQEELNSQVHPHFGSAPYFAYINTSTLDIEWADSSCDDHGSSGGCGAVTKIAPYSPDAICVAGMGQGALVKFQEAGIKVFQVPAQTTIQDVLALLKKENLLDFDPSSACAGHSH